MMNEHERSLREYSPYTPQGRLGMEGMMEREVSSSHTLTVRVMNRAFKVLAKVGHKLSYGSSDRVSSFRPRPITPERNCGAD